MKGQPNSHHQELIRRQKREAIDSKDVIARKRRRGKHETQEDQALPQPEVIDIRGSTDDSVDEDEDEDDFEDVDLNSHAIDITVTNSSSMPQTLVIPIKKAPEAEKKRKFKPISKEQRELRRIMHCECVTLMLIHGAIRNYWCNDYKLMQTMKTFIPHSAIALLSSSNTDTLRIVKSRRFLDGLKKIIDIFQNKFRVTNQGFILKNWYELKEYQARVDKNITNQKFQYLVKNFRGSKDIAAQAFVCILRSFGLKARLIFSLQVPDYTSISETPVQKPEITAHPSSETPRTSLNPKQKLLNNIRTKPQISNETNRKTNNVDFQDSEYPVFWVEVWDKYSEKWVSIDPISMKLIEIAPMRRRSKFEPPSSDSRNQLTYVIAYDSLGGVKDVTRRYAHYYNAKTIKKKIEFKSDNYKIWYERILGAVNSKIRLKKTRRDVLEMKEFHDRDLAEGMPNNVADFKNHPAYVLESQLKQNEVIYPKDSTSKCGMFRQKGKSKSKEVINVYKRSHVYILRSAKAWYMKGRVLKMGAQALKVRKSNNISDEENEEEDTRLYAEFQTSIFIPPPIVDGKIPKNVFGNIDCYQPHMIPENGYLVPVDSYSLKISEKAARILDIDYAKAIVAFDFSNRRSSRTPNAKEGGILVELKYKEAINLICDHLQEDELQFQRDNQELQSLKLWKYFLTKLRISDRLNAEHGEVVDEKNSDNGYYSVESDSSGSDVESGTIDSAIKRNLRSKHNEYMEDGGFMKDSDGDDDEEEEYDENVNQGQLVDDEEFEGGFTREFESAEIEEVDDGGFTKVHDSVEPVESETDNEGGFFFYNNEQDDVNPIHGEDPNDHNKDPSEELPDSLFHYNMQGELIYDPSGDGIETPADAIIAKRTFQSPVDIYDESSEDNEMHTSENETSVQLDSSTKPAPIQLRNQPLAKSPVDETMKIPAFEPDISVSEIKTIQSESEPDVISSLIDEVSEDEKEFAFEYDSD